MKNADDFKNPVNNLKLANDSNLGEEGAWYVARHEETGVYITEKFADNREELEKTIKTPNGIHKVSWKRK